MLVGKTGSGPSCKQEGINSLMISLAKAGKRVVRLKGGDPMIFGRAGEEIAACRAEEFLLRLCQVSRPRKVLQAVLLYRSRIVVKRGVCNMYRACRRREIAGGLRLEEPCRSRSDHGHLYADENDCRVRRTRDCARSRSNDFGGRGCTRDTAGRADYCFDDFAIAATAFDEGRCWPSPGVYRTSLAEYEATAFAETISEADRKAAR